MTGRAIMEVPWDRRGEAASPGKEAHDPQDDGSRSSEAWPSHWAWGRRAPGEEAASPGSAGRDRGGKAYRGEGGGRPRARPAHGPARARAPAPEPGARRARRPGAPREGGRGPGHDAGGARTRPRSRARRSVTDADAKSFYAANKARFGTASEADALQQIRAGLGQQRQNERRAAFARELKAKYDVKLLLEPYRVPVETGSAPVARQPEGAGDDRRVLGLPVPVLRARAADRQAGARGVRRQGPVRLPPLSRSTSTPRRRRRARRRPAPASRASSGRCTTSCGRTRRSCRSPTSRRTPATLGLDGAAFARLPRLRPLRLPGGARPRGRAGLRRLRHPGVLRQRAPARRRAALRGLRSR